MDMEGRTDAGRAPRTVYLIRKFYPKFHRLNGRAELWTAAPPQREYAGEPKVYLV
jgi:hypothetical protein